MNSENVKSIEKSNLENEYMKDIDIYANITNQINIFPDIIEKTYLSNKYIQNNEVIIVKSKKKKFFNKKASNPELTFAFKNFLKPDKNTKDNLKDNLEKNLLTISSLKILCLIFNFLIDSSINTDFSKEFGNYPPNYVYENFKKIDKKEVDLIKSTIRDTLQTEKININFFEQIIENHILQDCMHRYKILNYYSITTANNNLTNISEKDIKERELFCILFFFFQFKNSKYFEDGKVDFSSNYLTGDLIFRIIDPLRYLNNIMHLDFSSNRIGNMGTYSLGLVLKYNLKILNLDISGNVLNDSSIFFLLVGIGYYKFFDEKINEKGEKIYREITQDLILQNDKYNTTGLFKDIKQLKSKVKKNYDFTNQKNDCDNKFAIMLYKINISNNSEINDAELIVDLLKCCIQLKFLNIGRIPFKEQSEQILEFIYETVNPNYFINDYSKMNTTILEKGDFFLYENKTLNEDVIMKITDETKINNITRNNFFSISNLEYILLPNIKITEKGLNIISKIAVSPFNRIKVINLADNKLTEFNLCEFFKNLTKSKSLEELYLKECFIEVTKNKLTRESFLYFIRECPNLKNLNLYFNDLICPVLFYEVFQAVLERKNQLKVFDYSKNNSNYYFEEEKKKRKWR